MGVIDDNRLQTPGRSGYFRRTSVSYTQHDKRLIMQRHIEHRRRGTQGTSHTNLRTEYCITAMLRSANILTRVRKKTDTRRQPAPPHPRSFPAFLFPADDRESSSTSHCHENANDVQHDRISSRYEQAIKMPPIATSPSPPPPPLLTPCPPYFPVLVSNASQLSHRPRR